MAYSEIFEFADPHASNVAIPATGDGYFVDLIPEREVPGGILADRDFITEPFGAIEAVPNSTSDGTFRFKWSFTHFVGDPRRQFTASRPDTEYLGHQIAFTISLTRFASVIRVPLATVRTDAGTDYLITPADLLAPMRIRLRLYIEAYHLPSLADRRAATLASLHVHQGGVSFRQYDPPPDANGGSGARSRRFSVADFRTQFPEFLAATYPDSFVMQSLSTARELASGSDQITLNCAAHLLTISHGRTPGVDGGAGELMSEQMGQHRQQYATLATSGSRDVFFSTSGYGRMVLLLESRNPSSVFSAFVF